MAYMNQEKKKTLAPKIKEILKKYHEGLSWDFGF